MEDPQEEEKPIVTISPSEAEVLLRCETEHHYQYDEGFQAQSRNEGQDKGTLVHELTKVYYRRKLAILKKEDPGPPLDEQLTAMRLKMVPKLGLGPDDIQHVNKTVQEYFTFYQDEGWEPRAVEEWFHYPLFESDRTIYILYGKMDIIVFVPRKDKLMVVDTKSGARIYQSSPLDVQPMAYCLGSGITTFCRNNIGLQKSLKIEERFTRPIWPYDPEQLEEFRVNLCNKLLLYEVNTALGRYPMNNSACMRNFRKCDFHDVCYALPSNRNRRLNAFFTRRSSKVQEIIQGAKEALKK